MDVKTTDFLLLLLTALNGQTLCGQQKVFYTTPNQSLLDFMQSSGKQRKITRGDQLVFHFIGIANKEAIETTKSTIIEKRKSMRI